VTHNLGPQTKGGGFDEDAHGRGNPSGAGSNGREHRGQIKAEMRMGEGEEEWWGTNKKRRGGRKEKRSTSGGGKESNNKGGKRVI